MSKVQTFIVISLTVAVVVIGITLYSQSPEATESTSPATMPSATVEGEVPGEPGENTDITMAPAMSAPSEKDTATNDSVSKRAEFDPLTPRSKGNPDAPVHMLEYASLTCGHCATFHTGTLPEIMENYVEQGLVYVTFMDFPLNAPALEASMVARCLPEERYFGFIDLLFKTQEDWATRDYKQILQQNARLAGLSAEDYQACVENEALREAIGEGMETAQSRYLVNSTPTIVLNDGAEIITGARPFSYMKERIDALLPEAAEHEDTGVTAE